MCFRGSNTSNYYIISPITVIFINLSSTQKIIFKTTNQSKGDLPFKSAIIKNAEILGEGFGASKKAAEQAASKQVLNEL